MTYPQYFSKILLKQASSKSRQIQSYNSMEAPLDTQHFLSPQGPLQVQLYPHCLLIHSQQASQSIPFTQNSRFSLILDKYCNPTSLIINYNNKIAQLTHNNPTVLNLWQTHLATHLHKTHFSNDYQPLKKMASGLTATIHSALHKTSQLKVAVKVFNKHKVQKDDQQIMALWNQRQLLRKIGKSQFFPQFRGSYVGQKSYYLIYDWCQGITLKEWVDTGRPSQKQIKQIVQQLCQAIQQLNRLNIVHRDIKPENIIYNPATCKIKIVDFGFATQWTHSHHVYPHCGTPGYAAPQLLDKSTICITPQADVFSLGVTLYFMLLGELPYPKNVKSLVTANKQCKFQFSRILQSHASALNLIQRTVCPLKYRLTIEQVQVHPFLTGSVIGQRQNYSTATSPFTVNRIMSQTLQNEIINTKQQQQYKGRQQKWMRARMSSAHGKCHPERLRSLSKNKTNRRVAHRLITHLL